MPRSSPFAASFSLVARDLARSFAGHTVLDGVDLTIGPRTRVGVVGPNGVGKSTLLRLLAGLERPDRGSVTLAPATARVGYLSQEPDRRPGETLLASLARRTGVAAAEEELERAAGTVAAGTPGAGDAYAGALDRYLAAGGPDLEARARQVCADLGLRPDRLDAGTATLSGGQAARASLAGVLLSRFDVLLLDEPTNDLDFAGLARLERFVDELPGGVVIVSHDRAFLERTVTAVLELDEHSRTGTQYSGGFVAYLEQRATARRHAEEAYAGYHAERVRLQAGARTQRQWATEGVRRAQRDSDERDKFIRTFRVNSSEQLAAKAKATERALDRLEAVEKPWQGWDLRMRVAAVARSGDTVARLDGAVVERDRFTLGPVDLEITWGERVVIGGPNGSGKTTLLLALLGRLPLTTGTARLGPGVVVGEMDQARHRFTGGITLLDAFLRASGLLVADARSALAKFGLGPDRVLRPAGTLSPGERARAVLAQFSARGVNCLVLDEPTNYLDLPAIEQLEAALDTYEGTLLLVTHDRRFLESVRVTRAVAIAAGSVIRTVPMGESRPSPRTAGETWRPV
ncbi:MAG: ABC-F family ATP-binding cassette domain-containing protein [Acidimicrobiia bacterium]